MGEVKGHDTGVKDQHTGKAMVEGTRAGAGRDRPKDIEQVLRDSFEAARLLPCIQKESLQP